MSLADAVAAPLQGPFLLAVAALVVLAGRGARDRPGWEERALVALLAVLAVAPVLPLPFTSDSGPLRVFFAQHRPFGDWNHPPLPYLLNLGAQGSEIPWVTRLVPAGWVVGAALLTHALATRVGGRLAGALAGAWVVCDVRRLRLLEELGDWDLAACAVLLTLLWLDRVDDAEDPRAPSPRASVGTFALLLAAGLSSYSLVVLAGAVAAVHLVRLVRGRGPAAAAVAPVAALVALAGPLAAAFRTGRAVDAASVQVFRPEALPELLHVLPTGRGPTLVLLPLLALYGAWRIGGGRPGEARPWASVAVLLGVGLPVAVAVAAQTTRIHGFYYVVPAVPVLAVLAAAGWGDLLRRGPLAAARPATRTVATGVLAALTAFVTPIPDAADIPRRAAQVADFAAAVRGDARPVVSNVEWLPNLVWWADVQAGATETATWTRDTSAFRRRLTRTDCRTCEADPSCGERLRDAWFWFEVGPDASPEASACVAALADRCEVLPVFRGDARLVGGTCRP